MNRETEVRKLPTNSMMDLCNILQETAAWKTLMSYIPHDFVPNTYKYTHPQIKQIEEAASSSKKTGAEVLFDEWGTSGKKRPTLGLLLDLLVDLELYRAADFVAVNILNEPPSRRSQRTPSPPPEVTMAAEPKMVAYLMLEEACHWLDDEAAVLLGSGAFGNVYLGHLPLLWDTPVAVKKLQTDATGINRQFFTEYNALSRFRHENLVQLLGYSCDRPSFCLIYEFMSNGSLQDRLACLDEQFWECRSPAPLPWSVRLRIATDVARGLVYLHTFDTPVVHRDVKTANILLDRDFRAKLGDFGLARLTGENNPDESSSMTCAAGTSAYMAPEMHMGEITVLGDTFSYGVVLLELLTSLPPTDKDRESWDLILHVENCCEAGEITPLLDLQAGDWGGPCHEHAATLYNIAKTCHRDKEYRPYMEQLFAQLQDIKL